MQDTDKQKVYTTLEAAKLLGVSVRTVQLWVEAGDLQAWKTQGGHRRISEASLLSLLQARSPAPESAQETAAPKPSPLRVLLVGIDEQRLSLYTLAMSNLPFTIHWHNDATSFDGLISAGQFKPDVLFMELQDVKAVDIHMLQALASHAHTQQARIYMICALKAQELYKLGQLPDTVTLLSKPLHLTLFLELLSEAHHKVYLKQQGS